MRYAGVRIHLLHDTNASSVVLANVIFKSENFNFKEDILLNSPGKKKIAEYKGLTLHSDVWDNIYFIIPETHPCFNILYLESLKILQLDLHRIKQVEDVKRPLQQYFYDNYIKPIQYKLYDL
jgi:hypothetical protein